MKISSQFKKGGLALAAALSMLAPGLAHADAVAQSILNISGFTVTPSNGAALDLSSIQVGNNGDVSASFGGAAAVTQVANPGSGGFNLSVSAGPNAASYSPGTALIGAATLNYAGSTSSLSGNSLEAGGATAKVDNTVSLVPGGTGSTQSNVNLLSEFSITTDQASTFKFDFSATAFLRAYLSLAAGQKGTVNASYGWTLTIEDSDGNTVFAWTPDGTVDAITGGTETADAFDLTAGRATLTSNDRVTNNLVSGSFSAITNILEAGTYTFQIAQTSSADATVIPEPGSLALLGVALCGAAFAGRRRIGAKKAE